MMNSKMDSPIRVYLVDDQALVRAAIKELLSQDSRFEVIGDQGNPRVALQEIPELHPDVVLLDISMPELSGLDAISGIRKGCKHTKIVMLTHHEGQTFVEQALKAGADGYLSKSSDPEELALALVAVERGDPYVSPRTSASLVGQFRGAGNAPTHSTNLSALTPREREVFQLLAVGYSNKEIANKLSVSLGTAKKHRENLQAKLDCHSAAELARLAIREGLLDA
jgi:DNA-binding NarL/FixJ family response regulator